MRLAAIVPALLAVGCATTATTVEVPLPVYEQPIPLTVAIGHLVDNRLREDGQRLGQKQIRIAVAKVKNSIADALTRSCRFRGVVNLPSDLAQTSAMLEAARAANCDYLVMGEVDQFDIIDLGANQRMIASLPLEGLTLPIGVLVFILSGYRSGIWVNGAMYDRTAMATLSVSLHLVETENGKLVGHASNVVSSATKPVNALVYGDLSNPEDDWIDVGKELGAVALHNLAVQVVERLGVELERIHKKR